METNGNTMKPKPKNLIVALCEGLLGYQIYQARCGLNEVYTEYLLYDPILRIGKDKKWNVTCEYPITKEQKSKGDNRRIDFIFESPDNKTIIALEVKYLKSVKYKINIDNDVNKLKNLYCTKNGNITHRYLLICGKFSNKITSLLSKLIEKYKLNMIHEIKFVNQFRKEYGVMVFEIPSPS